MKKTVFVFLSAVLLFGVILAAGCVGSPSSEICYIWTNTEDNVITELQFGKSGVGKMTVYTQIENNTDTSSYSYQQYSSTSFTWKTGDDDTTYLLVFPDGSEMKCTLDTVRGAIQVNGKEYVREANSASGVLQSDFYNFA